MILLLALGCGAGPNDETLVDELRVLAMVAEPPEIAPGATSTVSVTVADPGAVGPDVLAWTCTDLGEGCLEAALPGFGATVGDVAAGPMPVTVTAPEAFAPAVADRVTVIPSIVWALACAPGECDAIDLVRGAPQPGSAEQDALAALLGDPFGMMADLPLHGPSLAFQQVAVSMRAAPVVNPVLTMTGELAPVAVGASIDLPFAVVSDDTVALWGYTTGGGFGAPSVAAADGEAILTWYAPEEAGDVSLWVVAVGDAGGSAVWSGTITAE